MKISINNIDWKIQFIPGSNRNLRRDDGTLTIGMTDSIKKTIFLNNKLQGDLLYKVLCHEIVHAFCFSYGIYIDNDLEEWLADFISEYGSEIVDKTDEILRNSYLEASGFNL